HSDTEGVLHVRRGMRRRKGKLLTVVALQLHFRAPRDLKAEGAKNIQDLVADEHDRMTVSTRDRASRKGQIKGRGLQICFARRALETIQARLKRLLQINARSVHLLADFTTRGCRNVAHTAQQRSELTLFSQELSTRSPEREFVGTLVKAGSEAIS